MPKVWGIGTDCPILYPGHRSSWYEIDFEDHAKILGLAVNRPILIPLWANQFGSKYP